MSNYSLDNYMNLIRKTVDELLLEGDASGHYDEEGERSLSDKEGQMAKQQLYNIVNHARELHEMLDDADQLPSWVQSKITKAADYIAGVKKHIEYKMMRARGDTLEEIAMPAMPAGPTGPTGEEEIKVDAGEKLAKVSRETQRAGSEAVDATVEQLVLTALAQGLEENDIVAKIKNKLKVAKALGRVT